jgi:hypothetical protein
MSSTTVGNAAQITGDRTAVSRRRPRTRDGFAIHLKHATKVAADRANRKQNEHLDAPSDLIGKADVA